MKITLTIEKLLQAFSFRVLKEGEKGVAPIDALNQVPLNALASNRARMAKVKIKPIVDTYFETVNKKRIEISLLTVEATEKYQMLITQFREDNGQDADVTDMENQLKTELFDIEHKINTELADLAKEENDLDIHQIKLSDFKIDPNGSDEDPDNWHPFKGEYFDFLDWLIVDDIDIPEEPEPEEIEIDGLDDAVEKVGMSE